VTIHVLQGEREMASGNKSLGQFNLSDIPPAPRGMPQIEVTFDIDANGILHVSAKDKATGKENKIKIQASSGLSEEEVQRMVQDAELHAEEDKKAHELAEARNQCDSMVHTVKKSLAEYGKELSDEEKSAIEKAVKEAEEVLREDNVEAIKAKSEALAAAAQKLGEKVYAKQQADTAAAQGSAGAGAGPGAGPAGSEAKKDDGEVVDAEYTEVKDKK
jgi:molecular chaperone DnaK